MKTTINQVVFQIIKECDQFCPHCFFNSSPKTKEKLTSVQIKNALEDLKKSRVRKIGKFIISGGEPVMHQDIVLIVKMIRSAFPLSKIRIDTNGIRIFENPSLLKLLEADIYDISVDIFHNQGMLKKEKKLKEIFVKRSGYSGLTNFFLKQRAKYKFELNIRWTSNGKDNEVFERFINKYKNKGVNITRKNVTATGRASKLSDITKGYLIEERPNNFKCLIGDSLLLAIDGLWYGCYHPVSLTRLSLPGNSAMFKAKLRNLLTSALGKKLPADGILSVLKSIGENNSKSKAVAESIVAKRYWYRCQPCEDACKKGIFSIK